MSKVGCPAQARIQIDIRQQSVSGWLETCWNRISPRFLGVIIPTPACSKDAVGRELTYHRCRGGQGCRVDAKHGGAAGTQEMLGRILPVAILRCYCRMCQDASWKVFWQSKMLEFVRVRVCQDTEGVWGEIHPHFMKVKYERENLRSQGKSIPVKDEIQLPLAAVPKVVRFLTSLIYPSMNGLLILSLYFVQIPHTWNPGGTIVLDLVSHELGAFEAKWSDIYLTWGCWAYCPCQFHIPRAIYGKWPKRNRHEILSPGWAGRLWRGQCGTGGAPSASKPGLVLLRGPLSPAQRTGCRVGWCMISFNRIMFLFLMGCTSTLLRSIYLYRLLFASMGYVYWLYIVYCCHISLLWDTVLEIETLRTWTIYDYFL